MKQVVGPLGAYLYAQPTRAGAPVAVLPAGLAVVGEIVSGERLYGEGRWIRVEGYAWAGRIIEEVVSAPCLLPRCAACGRFTSSDGTHRCREDGAA
jgi:hypothetical protein